jgi:hypothetical protein
MKRTKQARLIVIQKKMEAILRRVADLGELPLRLPQIEKDAQKVVASMPTLVRTHPEFEAIRSVVFRFKDLVRTMNRNLKALGRQIRKAGADPFENETNFNLVNRSLNAQLKILLRMEKDAKKFVKESEDLMRVGMKTKAALKRRKSKLN